MSGYLNDLSSEQQGKLQTFRSSCPKEGTTIWGVELSKASDARDIVLLKFLRATDFDVAEADKRIKATLEWRKNGDVDALCDAELPKDFQGYDHLIGHDKTGRPILVSHYGDMDVQKVFGDTDMFVKYRVAIMERAIRRLLPFEKNRPEDLFQIHDYKDVPIVGKDPLVTTGVKAVSKVLGDHYPEFKGKTMFVNFSQLLANFINIFTVFIPAKTRAKMVFIGTDLEPLVDEISPCALIEKLGGLYSPDAPGEWDRSAHAEVGGEAVTVGASGTETVHILSLDKNEKFRMKFRVTGENVRITSVKFNPLMKPKWKGMGKSNDGGISGDSASSNQPSPSMGADASTGIKSFASNTTVDDSASESGHLGEAEKLGEPFDIEAFKDRLDKDIAPGSIQLLEFDQAPRYGNIQITLTNSSWFSSRKFVYACTRD